MAKSLVLRQFDIAEANWKFQQKELSGLRRLVFIVEQSVPADEEWDGQDEEAWHWLATSPDGQPIGTARLLADGQVGRMAVLPDFRGKGIGAALLEQIRGKARRLGMSALFLHAQRHAEDFYVKAGFAVVGEPFLEAAIPHIKMTLVLQPDDPQRGSSAESDPAAISLKRFDTRDASWREDGKLISAIRYQVFVEEQQVPVEIEQDGRDDTAYHWLATDFENRSIGTVRLLPDGQIGRMAVLPEYRRQGIGFTLLELAVQKARRLALDETYLHAQSYAEEFYARAGFTKRGDEFTEAGILHVEMFQTFTQQESDADHAAPSGSLIDQLNGDEYLANAVASGHRLGVSNRVLLLRKEEDFRAVYQDLAQQTQLKLRIYSPWLDHSLYDNEPLHQAISRLARKNRHTEIQILIWNSHRVVKNGHALLEISRRLSSSIHIRVVHADYRQMTHEYMLADESGIVYRLDFEIYEGYANFTDKTEVNRLGREFQRAWDSSYEDPNLRGLRI